MIRPCFIYKKKRENKVKHYRAWITCFLFSFFDDFFISLLKNTEKFLADGLELLKNINSNLKSAFSGFFVSNCLTIQTM
jgi:hypothetical protein